MIPVLIEAALRSIFDGMTFPGCLRIAGIGNVSAQKYGLGTRAGRSIDHGLANT
jgi:hypothetical protein